MIVDTSAWIEFLTNTTSPASQRVRREIEIGADLVVVEPVLMELLIGTTDDVAAAKRRRFLHRFHVEPLAPMSDSEDAASIHRRCRRAGETVRNLIDCQIASIAMRLELPVLHKDRDFEVIREHCGLRTQPVF